MSTLEIAALVVAVALLLWQMSIFAQAAALLSRPDVTKVRYGVGPGLAALVIVLLVVFL